MKINVEIEIDWIDEESNIDDTVKQAIISEITSGIHNKVFEKLQKEIDQKIDEEVLSKINDMTEEIFNKFLDREVNITDQYGDVIKSFPKMVDLIKEKFDNFLTEPVDSNGKTETSRYGSNTPRITFMIDKQLKNFADKFTTDTVKTVSEEIKKHVQDGLTTKLGSELMKVLKVNDMLQLDDGKKRNRR